LPNRGIDYYVQPDAVQAATESNKPYFVSLSGLSLDDNLEMFKRACETKVPYL
jgi:dihydroorotate dehydrogenase (fumarate)